MQRRPEHISVECKNSSLVESQAVPWRNLVMLNNPVLILNQNYEPLNVCQVKRAIVLILNGKAEVTETDSSIVRSQSFSMISPSVVRLSHMVKRPRPKERLTRRRVFIRDQFTCQYCGKQTRELTLDHVVPRHAGGEHSWQNVTSACKQCNQLKAGYTPREAGMKLMRKPFQPKDGNYSIAYPFHTPQEWKKYLIYSKRSSG